METLLDYEELTVRLDAEYRKMLRRWENGGLYWHFKGFIRKFAKTRWVPFDIIKKSVCACLALSRLGLPITTAAVAHLTNTSINDAHHRLIYLTSYHVLLPTETQQHKRAWTLRGFRVSPGFLEHTYKGFKELENQHD